MTRAAIPFLIFLASCHSTQIRDIETIHGNEKAIESIKTVSDYIAKSDIKPDDRSVIYSTLAEADRALVDSSLAIKDCNTRESALADRVAKSDSKIWFWRKVAGVFFLYFALTILVFVARRFVPKLW